MSDDIFSLTHARGILGPSSFKVPLTMYEVLRRSKSSLLEEHLRVLFQALMNSSQLHPLNFKLCVRLLVRAICLAKHPLDNSSLRVHVFDFLSLLQQSDQRNFRNLSIFRPCAAGADINYVKNLSKFDVVVWYSSFLPSSCRFSTLFYGIMREIDEGCAISLPIFVLVEKKSHIKREFLMDLRCLLESKHCKFYIVEA